VRLIPKGWRDFQHYTNRNPPWIRLHRRLLDDRDFHSLPLASRALAPMLWLLASESLDGSIDGDVSELAFRLRQTEKEIDAALKPLISKGFFVVQQDASSALADCTEKAPRDRGDTETDTETEEIAPTELVASAAPNRPQPPPSFDGKNAEALNGKAVVAISQAFELPEQWGFDAEALGFKPQEVLREAERFRQYWTSGNGKGRRRKVTGWRQSWSNWLSKAEGK
jgi:hypothetical protein